MKKVILILTGMIFTAFTVQAQSKYFTREGKVSFVSKAPMENIESMNRKATSVLDIETGQIEFSILMKAFEFEKALMQEHFNENYVESNKYPKAVFKGTITNNKDVMYTKDGEYSVVVSGKMTLHGETKDQTAKGTIMVKGGKISGHSEFELALADYKIAIPSVVKDKVSEIIKITVDVDYEMLQPK